MIQRTEAWANAGVFGAAAREVDVCRAAPSVVIASTAAKTNPAFVFRVGVLLASFIASLRFVSACVAETKASVEPSVSD